MPEEKVIHSPNCIYDPLTGRGNPCSCGAAADAGPRQPSECPTCGSKNPFDYNYSCHKNADGWHRANWNLAAPPVPQEAAPCPTCGALGQYHKFVFHPSPSTAPDWAMRVARKIWEYGWYKVPEPNTADLEEIAHSAALIREAGSDESTKLKQELFDLRTQRYENMDKFRFRGKTAAELTELIARGEAGSERERELETALRNLANRVECLTRKEGMDDEMIDTGFGGVLAEAERLLGGEAK